MFLIYFIQSVICTSIFGVILLQLDSTGSATIEQNNVVNKSVIVIGVGVSGLIAATKLIKEGYVVTVLEAGDYIGGRIKTRSIGEYDVEFGAEWVHGEKNNSVFELMEPYGLFITNENDENNNETEPYDLGNIFATQTGEEMDSSFNEIMQTFLDILVKEKPEDDDDDDDDDDTNDEDTEDNVSNSTISKSELRNTNISESFGTFAVKLFETFNEKNPVHDRETIRAAALDWIHRNVNIEDGSDTWFVTSHSDEGEQYEFLEGNLAVAWKPPASYTSLLKVILGQSPNDTSKLKEPDWKINFLCEVIEINYMDATDNMVTVTCKDGRIFKADHVITTVSLGVLKAKHSTLFKPALSLKKQLAIENIGFGTVNKIYLEFENEWWFEVDENFTGLYPLWEEKGGVVINSNWLSNSSDSELLEENEDGIPVWCRSIESISLVDSKLHPKVLQVWMSGVSARFMESLDMASVTNATIKLIRKFLGKRFQNIPNPIRSERSTWYTNEFFRGSYSYRALDSDKYDIWAKDLAEPILNNQEKPILTFAGEATHENYYSTVHGAYDSGIREANRIINFYKTD